jgi:DNA polymerase-3 subunit alpha
VTATLATPHAKASAPPFAHLHLKSQFSLLSALGTPKAIVKRASALGMTHVALTDEMNLFGAVEFFTAAKKAGIKPIMGAELIVSPGPRTEKNKVRDNRRLVALIENEQGYVNLNFLLEGAYFGGRHFKPRVDMELLEAHHEGLIFLSGDLRGEIPRLLARGRPEEAEEVARRYAGMFGEGNFFLELMDLGWGNGGGLGDEADQYEINKGLRALSAKTGIPTVATNNVHYPTQDHAFLHEVLMCLGMSNTIQDEFRFRFPSDQFFMKSAAQMAALFDDDCDAEAIANTMRIADRCNFEFVFGEYRFPVYPHLEGRTPEQVLRDLSEKGLNTRLERVKLTATDRPWEEIEAEYRDRLEVELKIIVSMKFAAYFLIVYDFINWAREADIPVGPGRGSGAGSLVLYSLRITDIDPMPYALLFERFLNPERVSMPDVDVDFCQDRRGEVIDYVGEAYGGSTRVTQIITFGKMLAKGVLRDVGRVMGFTFAETDRIAKLVPDQLGITLPEAQKKEARLPKLMAEDPRVNRLIKIAEGLEGTTRHCSVHAAGVVIADDDLRKYCPLYKGAGDSDPGVTQFDMKWAEEIGLIKFDFLGLKTITQIKNALDMARADGKTDWSFFPFAEVPLDDEDVYRLLTRGDTLGVFQLESSGMRELLRALKPTQFEDIIAVAALYRPGPMGLGMHHTFVDCKHGRKRVTYPHEMLKPILSDTYGVIVFQEQVMQIAQVMGGYSLGQADILRRAMGKKKLELMAEHRVIFTKGATDQGVTEKVATDVFDLMAEFAKYGFNKSHTAAYGLIAYQTAWVKHHLPAYFYASLLTIESSNTDKVLLYVDDARRHKVEVLPPDVNESALQFRVIDEKVRFGLTAIKGVGDGAITTILAERESGPFESVDDFLSRVDLDKVNKRVIEALIKCGAFDSMGRTRAALHASLERIVEYGRRKTRDRASGQVGLFGMLQGGATAGALHIPELPEWAERERLALEKEALGFYITGHPMGSFQAEVRRFSTHTSAGLAEKARELRGGGEIKLAGVVASMKVVVTKAKGLRMSFVQFEDMVGSVEVTVFPKTFAKAEHLLVTDQPLLLTAKLDEVTEEGQVKLLADDVALLSEIREQQTKEVRLKLPADAVDQSLMEALSSVVEANPGRAPVSILLTTESKVQVLMDLPREQTVRPSERFVEAVTRVVGKDGTTFL